MSITNFNPWKVTDAFAPMFNEQVTLTHNPNGATDVGKGCVFPIETVDPFAESDIENDAKSISVLLCKECASSTPKISDEVVLEDGSRWNVAQVEDEQTWWKLICRGGLVK